MLRSVKLTSSLALVCLALALAACGGAQRTIPGTEVADSGDNRDIVRTVENYRLAVERRDAAALVLMAHPDYWEDGGTPSGADDYGYEGLKQVLARRFQSAESIRYSIKYVGVKYFENRAWVDVIIHASYEVQDGRGELVRRDMRDQNQIVLEQTESGWKFLSGM